jgi:hypothetical protein
VNTEKVTQADSMIKGLFCARKCYPQITQIKIQRNRDNLVNLWMIFFALCPCPEINSKTIVRRLTGLRRLKKGGLETFCMLSNVFLGLALRAVNTHLARLGERIDQAQRLHRAGRLGCPLCEVQDSP